MNRQGKESETPAVTAEKGPCQHKHKFSITQLRKGSRDPSELLRRPGERIYVLK